MEAASARGSGRPVPSASRGWRPVAAGPKRLARRRKRALLGAGKRARHRKVLEARRLESTGPRIPLPQFPQPGRAARRDVRAVEALDLVVGVPHVAGRRVDAVERASIARAVLEEYVHGAAPCEDRGVAPRRFELRRHRRRGRDQRLEPWKFSRVPERSRAQPRERSGVARHKLARVQQRRLRYLVVQCGGGRVRRRLRGPRLAKVRTILLEPRRGRGADATVDVGPEGGIDGRVRAQKRCREHPGRLLSYAVQFMRTS